VEHPVTEMVTGLDIVALQIEVARGRPLPLAQADVPCRGHAVDCRINAEDPVSFAPAPGRIASVHLPGGPGVRVDTHVAPGTEVPPYYDSMIGKVIAHGATRDEAIARLRCALAEMRIEGLPTNIPLHLRLLQDEGFARGEVSIHHLETLLAGPEASHG
jgi:acetyl-CoA carboxylase biotin carboxylase subunit